MAAAAAAAEDAGPAVAAGAGLLLLEHLNLNVLSAEEAWAFQEALGCVRVARPGTLHTNCGPLTQFHLPSPESKESITSAQLWRGVIEVLYPDEAAVQAAGERLRPRWPVEPAADVERTLRVRDSYGNRYRLQAASPGQLRALGPASGERPGSAGAATLALGGVSLEVPVGAAGPGARFYEQVLGFRAEALGEGRWAVRGGPGQAQRLVLEEVEGCDGLEGGEHMAIYIGDFAGCFERLRRRGLTWVNPRFVHLDQSTTLEEALHYMCFRFKDVVDLETGRKLFELEHEVRSTEHPSCPLLAK